MNTNTGDTFEMSAEQAEALKRLKEDFKTPMQPGTKPMTELTAEKIGFRELTPQESSAVRELRKRGDEIKRTLEELKSMGADPRWLAIATTHFQEGLMAGVRAVTRPAFF